MENPGRACVDCGRPKTAVAFPCPVIRARPPMPMRDLAGPEPPHPTVALRCCPEPLRENRDRGLFVLSVIDYRSIVNDVSECLYRRLLRIHGRHAGSPCAAQGMLGFCDRKSSKGRAVDGGAPCAYCGGKHDARGEGGRYCAQAWHDALPDLRLARADTQRQPGCARESGGPSDGPVSNTTRSANGYFANGMEGEC